MIKTMQNMEQLQADRKAKQASDRMVWDMKEAILQIPMHVLRNLDAVDMARLAGFYHPKHGMSNLSRSEQMQKEDEISCVISYVKAGIK